MNICISIVQDSKFLGYPNKNMKFFVIAYKIITNYGSWAIFIDRRRPPPLRNR